MEKNAKSSYSENEEELDVKEIALYFLRYWRWIILSMILATGLGYLYLQFTPKKYLSESKILINTGNHENLIISGLTNNMSDFSDLSTSKLDDWIEMLKSRRLVSKVIDKLDLNVQYNEKKGFISKNIYKEDASVYIKFVDEKSKFLINKSIYLEVTVNKNNQFICKDITTTKTIKVNLHLEK